MNEIIEVAKAYYNEGKAEDKKLAQQFFKSLDENGDGKVSVEEFKKKVDPTLARNFWLIDENCDGTLDFNEVLAAYYMKKVSIPSCSACREVLFDAYFSCLRCRGKTSYRLCCNCYGIRKVRHHHPPDDFADSRALLKLLEQLMGQTQVAPSRRDILENSDDARGLTALKAFKEALGVFSPQDIAEAADKVIKSTDAYKDNLIDITGNVEAIYQGIDVTENMEVVREGVQALNEGLNLGDLGDIIVELGTAAASSGCCIM